MSLPARFGWIAVPALIAAEPACASNEAAWDRAGDIGRGALVLVALGTPVAAGDRTGAWQAGGSIGATWLATEAIKQTLPHRRPDGSDRRSLPSGHTSMAFAAAATLHKRNGWVVGLPAQALAAFVGVSRVQARRHHWYDVLAGAAIGEAAGMLLTSPRNDRVRLVPWGDTRSAGVSVAARF